MLALFIGGSELARAIDNSRKVTLVSRVLADLTSQGDTVNPMAAATMQDILSSASLVLAPYNSNSTSIVISAVGVYATNLTRPYICSSTTLNGVARTAKANATDITVPPTFQLPGMRYVLAEVSMPYQPIFGSAVMKTFTGAAGLTFKVGMPWPVRAGKVVNSTYSEVILPSGVACPLTP
ncbi:Flp pilus assembly protein TadG [Methylobacterium brachythecii]|nr:Flp pilus assembly protein TadG [Methylobacterium brachythecii]